MSEIQSVNSSALQRANAARGAYRPTSVGSSIPETSDRVELSAEVKTLLDRLDPSSAAPGSSARIESIRQQIRDGSYETPEKLDLAIDRLLRDLQA
jgi:anti-sigma28 factor (negative regulator of flagellin synthesis)